MKQFKKSGLRLVAFVLSTIILMSVPVSAATNEEVMPCASYYLNSYSAYVYVTDSGSVQVWYDVMGTGYMDEIGSLSIMLYESTNGTTWTRVKTFLHENYSSMLAYDDYYHSSHVSYQGVSTRQYKAYICFWAGKNGSGDTRYMWAYEA